MITNPERIERLTKLRELADKFVKARRHPIKLAPGVIRRFNADVWDCGTVACVLGSAALIPWFQERGLKIIEYNGNFYPVLKDKSSLQLGADLGFNNPESEQYSGIMVGAMFFRIEEKESEDVFLPAHYHEVHDCYFRTLDVKPSAVRKRVDKLIKKYSKSIGVFKS